MRYKDCVDLHVHTDNSPDGNHSSTLICEYACNQGLRAICFTDHCECDAYYKDRYDLSLRQSVFEAYKSRSVFSGKLLVLAGVELGQPLQNLAAAENALLNKLDFVLASNHTLTTKNDDFYLLDYSLPENNPDLLFSQYLIDLNNIIDWGKFDSLAHLTYPLRYIIGEHKIDFNLKNHMPQIEDVLKKLAQSGKALEINTSGLRQEYGTMMPDLETVKLFRSVGGEYITVGSDAHNYFDVGAGIEQAFDLAKAAGFNFVTIYENRTAIPILIK